MPGQILAPTRKSGAVLSICTRAHGGTLKKETPSKGQENDTAKVATLVVNQAASTPSRLRGRGGGVQYQASAPDMEDYDDEADAEGEIDEDVVTVKRRRIVEEDENDDDEADAPVAEEDYDDGCEFVGAVKTRASRSRSKRKLEEEDEDLAVEDDESADRDSDESSNGGGEDWEAADGDIGEDLEVGNASANHCR